MDSDLLPQTMLEHKFIQTIRQIARGKDMREFLNNIIAIIEWGVEERRVFKIMIVI